MTNVMRLLKKPVDRESALRTLDDLREHIADGRVIAFAAVGIEPNGDTRRWTAATDHCSKLQVIGAMYHMLHCYEMDDDA